MPTFVDSSHEVVVFFNTRLAHSFHPSRCSPGSHWLFHHAAVVKGAQHQHVSFVFLLLGQDSFPPAANLSLPQVCIADCTGDALAIPSGCASSCKTKAGEILEESGAGVNIVHVDNVAFVFDLIVIYKARATL